jgi:hypothetical protein
MTTLLSRPIPLAGAVLAGALLATSGAVLLPSPAAYAAAPSCAVGTPVSGDVDGDGSPDLLVATVDENHTRYRRLPGDGGAASWVDADFDRELRAADLNGDVCADAMTADGNDLLLYLGTPAGLDTAAAVRLELPRAGELDDPERLNVYYAGMRNNGVSQIAVAGSVEDDGGFFRPFLDVVTLDATAHLASVQSFDLAALGARADEYYQVSADNGLVAVGAPFDSVGSKLDAGAVYVFSPVPATPTTLAFRTRLTQNSAGVPGGAETGDAFGYALSLRDGRLAIGVPYEANGRVKEAGLVQPILWNQAKLGYTAYRSITQGTAGVPGTDEKADHFGAAVAVTRGLTAAGSYDIAIGAPDENVGSKVNAGSITVANFTRKLFRTCTASTKGVPGTAERNDAFGYAVAALRTSAATDTLVLGVTGEETGDCNSTGSVLRSNGRKLSSSTTWTQIAPPGCDYPYAGWGFDFGS